MLTDRHVRVVQLLCAGFTLGVVFMGTIVHFHIGTLCGP
jgi:hypothetical protein